MQGHRLRRLIIYVAVVPILIAGVVIIKRILPNSPTAALVAGWSGILLTVAFQIAKPTRDELQLEKLERANREHPLADDTNSPSSRR